MEVMENSDWLELVFLMYCEDTYFHSNKNLGKDETHRNFTVEIVFPFIIINNAKGRAI